MQIGMVGLGRMGANMTTRLVQGGHAVVAFDLDAEAVRAAVADGAAGADSLAGLVGALPPPRTVWLMVPAGAATEQVVDQLAGLLAPGDTLVDGGNARWADSQHRSARLATAGIDLVDAGTSGGVWGLAEGYCLMVGGAAQAVARLAPALDTLAPPGGWTHVGPSGAGHFTKMVHNGVEYALMQAYAEGFELLAASDFDLDLPAVAELWRHGSVVRSWLLDLVAAALADDPDLERVVGYVEDSGEGRWTVEAAIDRGVPAPTIALSLFARFASRQDDAFGPRLLAALRQQFGGHAVRRPQARG